MIRFLADHCFDEDVLRGVVRRNQAIQFLLARDAGLAEAEDAAVLEWAARRSMVIVTHDRNTMVGLAVERIERQEPMGGLVVVAHPAPFFAVIQDIILLAECTELSDWQDRIEYVPL